MPGVTGYFIDVDVPTYGNVGGESRDNVRNNVESRRGIVEIESPGRSAS